MLPQEACEGRCGVPAAKSHHLSTVTQLVSLHQVEGGWDQLNSFLGFKTCHECYDFGLYPAVSKKHLWELLHEVIAKKAEVGTED